MSGALEVMLEEHVVEPGVAPGASAAVAYRCDGTWRFEHAARGLLSTYKVSPATTQTLYDLASITKSVTAIVATNVLRMHGVDLGVRTRELLPELSGTPSADATLLQLLSHRAGLHAHVALYAPLLSGRALEREQWLVEAANARRPECPGAIPENGFPAVYSDVGFALAGAALESLTGERFDDLVESVVYRSNGLGLRSARHWLQSGKTPSEFAPTEHVAWRGGEIRALVHDENAFAIAGSGAAGHAGLFATALDVARFGAALLDAWRADTPLVHRATLRRLLTRHPDSSLAAGFDTVSQSGSSAGPRFSEQAFGHLGFTGTSYWCDPKADVVVALLTNRVCPTRDHIAIRAARPAIHTRMFDYARIAMGDAGRR